MQVDDIMERFNDHFAADPTDAYGIFIHVITYEFHHKGQAMTMARLLVLLTKYKSKR